MRSRRIVSWVVAILAGAVAEIGVFAVMPVAAISRRFVEKPTTWQELLRAHWGGPRRGGFLTVEGWTWGTRYAGDAVV